MTCKVKHDIELYFVLKRFGRDIWIQMAIIVHFCSLCKESFQFGVLNLTIPSDNVNKDPKLIRLQDSCQVT